MINQNYSFLFHGTSREKVEQRLSHQAGYSSGTAANPDNPSETISGCVTSTTPDFLTALGFAENTTTRFQSGLLTEFRSATPTILVVTNPGDYDPCPVRSAEHEIILWGMIKQDDFVCLDQDLDFLVEHFPDFGQYVGGFSEKVAMNVYTRLLDINNGLKDYRLIIPNDLKNADREINRLHDSFEKRMITSGELKEIERTLRGGVESPYLRKK